MAKVLNMRDVGFSVPAGAEYVGRGRGSKFGNPYEMGRDGSREEVIEKFEMWLLSADNGLRIEDLRQLKGKDLVCWCAPQACHAEVLLKYIPNE